MKLERIYISNKMKGYSISKLFALLSQIPKKIEITVGGENIYERVKIKDNLYILDGKTVMWCDYRKLSKGSTETIPEGMFDFCYGLKKVNVPKELNKIAREAFAFTQVDIQSFLNNSNLKTIECSAFWESVLKFETGIKRKLL